MAETWFTPKEWKARLVEFAGRRLLRNVANGETVTYDVSRSEGQVSQEGDAFNTKNMNDLEQRISNGFANAKTNIDALNRDLDGMKFGTDGDGNRGYYGADGSLIPFNRMTDYTFYVAAQGHGGGLTFPRSFLDAAGFTKADIHSSKGMHAFNTATTHKNRILYSVHDEIGVDISSKGKFTEGFSVFQLGDGGTGGIWGTVRLYK